jgi:LuxR family maltose regulon positive regulatory protein
LREVDAELAGSRSMGWRLRSLTLEVMRAVALARCGAQHEALDQLRDALTFAADQGFVRRILDEGSTVLAMAGQLLARERSRGQGSDLVDYLQRLAGNEGDRDSAARPEDLPPQASPVLREPLTRKELQVLRLLAEGRSNQALADELGVSDTTVRTHLRNINAKLDVGSRMQAVVRARQIGLLK